MLYGCYTTNIGGATLPSGFGLSNATGVFVPFALSDITTLYEAMIAVVSGGFSASAKAVSDINAATTVSAVQAITLSAP